MEGEILRCHRKITRRFSTGSVSQLVNFNECLDIGLKEKTSPNIRDRYCLGEVTVKVPEAYLKRYYSV